MGSLEVTGEPGRRRSQRWNSIPQFLHSNRAHGSSCPALQKSAPTRAPGVTIVGISEGEGYVVMWPEGGEKVMCPWREGTVFVPPNHWYHQHVNTGPVQNRQLRIFPPRPMMGYNIRDMRQQIEYVDETPWIRQKFEEELAKTGLTSLMPEESYRDPNFKFDDEEMQGD